jgi:hypothetical protein
MHNILASGLERFSARQNLDNSKGLYIQKSGGKRRHQWHNISRLELGSGKITILSSSRFMNTILIIYSSENSYYQVKHEYGHSRPDSSQNLHLPMVLEHEIW